MKSPILLGLTVCLAVAFLCAGDAQAQFGRRNRPAFGPGYRPNLSPYLNLLRGGNTAANYYLGVRPETERRQNASQFNREISTIQREVTTIERDQDPDFSTGTPGAFQQGNTFFGNTRGFYPSPLPGRR